MGVILHSVFCLLLALLVLTSADLDSDKEALLNFATLIHHSKFLNWSSTSPPCQEWIGIKCDTNSTRVISIRLPGKRLVGEIPADTLGKLDNLKVLSLRSNHLSGQIPLDILSSPSLQSLFLQHNLFSGDLPSSLPPRLTVLDLSNNNFSGSIPDLNYSQVRHLNLSSNNLSGSIPDSLTSRPNSSFFFTNLCGLPLTPCPKHSSKFKLWVIIAIGGGAFAVIFLAAAVLLYCCFRRSDAAGEGSAKGKSLAGEKPREDFGSGAQAAEKNKLVFFEGSSYNFDLEDLLRASAEVLGKGSYGTAYKAVLEESTTVVVKRLKEVLVGKKEFEQQMELIGKLPAHRHVTPLRAYYYSKDEKLLVYDYFPKGSLSALLHGERNGGTGRAVLDWNARVKLILGTARGLAHIHAAGGKLVHGNVKSSNVVINEEGEACVADMGLSVLMNVPVRNAGYRAPEAGEGRRNSQKGDVYGMGVVVLEMLTGKAPVQSPGREEMVDLPRWVQSVVREEWTAEVFDVELMRHAYVEEEMVQMLQIGMACVAKLADQRPTMPDVVRMIEDIRLSDADNRSSH